jgi:hypothetical protein
MFQSEYNMRLYLSLAQQISILLIAVVWIIFCTVHYCYNSQDNPTVEKLNSSRPPGLLHSFAKLRTEKNPNNDVQIRDKNQVFMKLKRLSNLNRNSNCV